MVGRCKATRAREAKCGTIRDLGKRRSPNQLRDETGTSDRASAARERRRTDAGSHPRTSRDRKEQSHRVAEGAISSDWVATRGAVRLLGGTEFHGCQHRRLHNSPLVWNPNCTNRRPGWNKGHQRSIHQVPMSAFHFDRRN